LFFLEVLEKWNCQKDVNVLMAPIFAIVIYALALGESVTVVQGIATGLMITDIHTLLLWRH
jgi:hypothetical protein